MTLVDTMADIANSSARALANPSPVLPLGVGLHYNVPAATYHADPCPEPSLSSGIARVIIGKSLAHAHAEHPRLGKAGDKKTTKEMNTGLLVHSILAETDGEIVLGDFATFQSKASKEWAASVRADGKIPALQHHYDEALPIAAAFREKAARGTTDRPFVDGAAEVTGIWTKENGGHTAYFRARYDRLITPEGEPWTAWDWKVTSDVSTNALQKKIVQMGYHYQAAHYLDGMNALCPQFAGRHSFILCFAEEAAPHSVRRVCLSESFMGIASPAIGTAHDKWAHAMKTNKWPDLSSERTTFIQAPGYLANQLNDE